jgi:glycerol-3-phosphate dehydrogenase
MLLPIAGESKLGCDLPTARTHATIAHSMDRDRNLKAVAERREPWDIVVIGGGAAGAGCVLDAASRGFSVLLLEQHDFGKGTSSRSTKLIHAGVRYLRQGDISLVRESLRERGLLLKNAPHVVRKLEFVIPCYSVWGKFFYGIGLKIYDLLAGKYSIGRSRSISRGEVVERLPNVRVDGLNGGIVYQDAQFDDARMLIDMLRTAESHGAVVLNYAPVVSLTKEINKISGVEFKDVETGDRYSVNAHVVINATGAFCSTIQEMSDVDAKPVVTFSQGVHLVFERKFLPGDAAIMIPKTRDGRVLFCIPWKKHVLVGTTDTPVDSPTLEPKALETEIDFILETSSNYLSTKPTRTDIKSIFAGIRPLIKSGNRKTASLSRGHDLFVDATGLVTITGGKWTTFRKMAEDAVDKAIDVGGLRTAKCVTADLPIEPPETDEDDTILHADFAFTRGDVVKFVRDEMARTVEDVLARRTRVLFTDAAMANSLAPEVARMMAEVLGRDDQWVEQQINEFRKLAAQYLPKFYSEMED